MNSEPIYAALFALGQAATGIPVANTSRRLRMIDEMQAAEFPAFFQQQLSEDWLGTPGNLPPRGTAHVSWILYVDNSDLALSHSQQLNPLKDALLASLGLPPAAPSFRTGTQNLGGLVESVRLEGTIKFAEGVLANRGLAVIPLVVKFNP
jgi:hypothetical protein